MRVRIINEHGSYKGRYFDKTGTIFSCDYADEYSKSNTIGVQLDNINNPASKHNCFWFQRGEIEIVVHDNIDMESDAMSNKEPIANIVNLWKENQLNLLNEEYERVYKIDIIHSDPKIQAINSLIDDFITKLNQYQKDYDVCFKSYKLDNIKDLAKGLSVSYDSSVAIEYLNNKKSFFETEINRIVKEVMIMVAACETYEQQMQVLKNYRIVNDDFRLKNDSQYELTL